MPLDLSGRRQCRAPLGPGATRGQEVRCRVNEGRYFFLPLPGSYLNETLSLVRNASTLPFSMTRSCWITSATRRSRRLRDASLIAEVAASSQDFWLVPISSRTL